MTLTRREFGKRTSLGLLAAAVGVSLGVQGCNVVQDLINYIPYIQEAIAALNSILGAFMPAAAKIILEGIQGGLGTLQGALVEYQNDTNPADKATIIAKIETFLKDIGDNFQQFLDALGAAGSIASVVLGIVQVVLSTIAWFAQEFASLTARQAMPIAKGMQLRAKDQYLYIVPTKRSIKQFKADFNQVVYSNGHRECWIY